MSTPASSRDHGPRTWQSPASVAAAAAARSRQAAAEAAALAVEGGRSSTCSPGGVSGPRSGDAADIIEDNTSDDSVSASAALEDALHSTNLGDLWFERGKLKEARDEHLWALKIRTAWLPRGHPDVAESLESLGNVAIREGNHLEAEGLHRKALEMRIKVLGPRHMDVAATLNNLAVSLKAQPGKLAEAEVVCKRAMTIVQDNCARGHNTRYLLAALLKLQSKILKRQGRKPEAIRLRSKAMAILEDAAAATSELPPP